MRKGRHGRPGSWEGDSQPPRSQERAEAIRAEEADPAKRAPGKKDKWAYCKVNRGAHTPVIMKNRWLVGNAECRWDSVWSREEHARVPGWICFHHEECSGCGKFYRHISREECPDYYELSGLARDKILRKIAESMERQARWRRPKQPVNGPQGYRKKKKNSDTP